MAGSVSKRKADITRSLPDINGVALRSSFSLLDRNKDGKISRCELEIVMAALGIKTNKEDIKRLMKEGDNDGNGYIDSEEYYSLLETKIQEMRTSTYFIEKSFTLLDLGSKGYLTINDLSSVTGMHGERLTAPEAKEIMEDGNGKDDRLYFEDFERMILDTS